MIFINLVCVIDLLFLLWYVIENLINYLLINNMIYDMKDLNIKD